MNHSSFIKKYLTVVIETSDELEDVIVSNNCWQVYLSQVVVVTIIFIKENGTVFLFYVLH